MAAKYYYFTEPLSENIQGANNTWPYGPYTESENDYFRLCNLFEVPQNGLDQTAYAVCSGSIRMVVIDPATTPGITADLCNIILKPDDPIPGAFGHIDYIIYKGVRIDSIISDEAFINENDLSKVGIYAFSALGDYSQFEYVQNDFKQLVQDDILLIPNADKGGEVANPQDPFIYWGFNGKPLKINAGESLGIFHKEKFGIEIVSERPGRELITSDYKTLDHILAKPSSSLSDIEKHEATDKVLSYSDSVAFFSSLIHYNFRYKKRDENNATIIIDTAISGNFAAKLEKLNSNVLSGSENLGNIYLDIRNERDLTLDHYTLYSEVSNGNIENLVLYLSEGDPTLFPLEQIIDYYSDDWPITVLNHTQLSFINGDISHYTFKLELPLGESVINPTAIPPEPREDRGVNGAPRAYLQSSCRVEGRNYVDNPKVFFLGGKSRGSGDKFTNNFSIKLPKTDQIFTNYIKIVYYSRQNSQDYKHRNLAYQVVNSNGDRHNLIPSVHEMDNLFPLKYWNVNPYASLPDNSRIVRVFRGKYPINSRFGGLGRETKYCNIGISLDKDLVTFFAFPCDGLPSKAGDYGVDKTLTSGFTSKELPFILDITKDHPMGYFTVSSANIKIYELVGNSYEPIEEERFYLTFLERAPKYYHDQRLANFHSITITYGEYVTLGNTYSENNLLSNFISYLGFARVKNHNWSYNAIDHINHPNATFQEFYLDIKGFTSLNECVRVGYQPPEDPNPDNRIKVYEHSFNNQRTVASQAAISKIALVEQTSDFFKENNARALKHELLISDSKFDYVLRGYLLLGRNKKKDEYYGPHIETIQRILFILAQSFAPNDINEAAWDLAVDGYIGNKTKKWVKIFQQIVAFPGEVEKHDGIIGPDTIRAIDEALGTKEFNYSSLELLHDSLLSVISGEKMVISPLQKITSNEIKSYIESGGHSITADDANDLFSALITNGYIDRNTFQLTHRFQPDYRGNDNTTIFKLNLVHITNRWSPYATAIKNALITLEAQYGDDISLLPITAELKDYYDFSLSSYEDDVTSLAHTLEDNNYGTISDTSSDGTPSRITLTDHFKNNMNDPDFILEFNSGEILPVNDWMSNSSWAEFEELLITNFTEYHLGPRLYKTTDPNEAYYDHNIYLNRHLPAGTNIILREIIDALDDGNIFSSDPWCFVEVIDPVYYKKVVHGEYEGDEKLSQYSIGYIRLSSIFQTEKQPTDRANLYHPIPNETSYEIASKFYQGEKDVLFAKYPDFYASVICYVNNYKSEENQININSFNPDTGKFELPNTKNEIILAKENDSSVIKLYDDLNSADFVYNIPTSDRTLSNWTTVINNRSGVFDSTVTAVPGSVTSNDYLWIPSVKFVETLRAIAIPDENEGLLGKAKDLMDFWPVGYGVKLGIELAKGWGLPEGRIVTAGVEVSVSAEVTVIKPDENNIQVIAKAGLGAKAEVGTSKSIGRMVGVGATERNNGKDRTENLVEFGLSAGVNIGIEIEFTFPYHDDNAIAAILVGILSLTPTPVTRALGTSIQFLSTITNMNIDPWSFVTKLSMEGGASLQGSIGLNLLATKEDENNSDPSKLPSLWGGDADTGTDAEKLDVKRDSFDPQQFLSLPLHAGYNVGIAIVAKVEWIRKYKEGKLAYDKDTGDRLPSESIVVRSFDQSMTSSISGLADIALNNLFNFEIFGEQGGGHTTTEQYIHTDLNSTSPTSYYQTPTTGSVDIQNYTRITNKSDDRLLFESKVGVTTTNTVINSNESLINNIKSFELEKSFDYATLLGLNIETEILPKQFLGIDASYISILRFKAQIENNTDAKDLITRIVNTVVTPYSNLTTSKTVKEYYQQQLNYIYARLLTPIVETNNNLEQWNEWKDEFINYLELDPVNGLENIISIGLSAGMKDVPILKTIKKIIKISIKISGAIIYKETLSNISTSDPDRASQIINFFKNTDNEDTSQKDPESPESRSGTAQIIDSVVPTSDFAKVLFSLNDL